MGRFNCVHCKREYYSKRFIWEPDCESVDVASSEEQVAEQMSSWTYEEKENESFYSQAFAAFSCTRSRKNNTEKRSRLPAPPPTIPPPLLTSALVKMNDDAEAQKESESLPSKSMKNSDVKEFLGEANDSILNIDDQSTEISGSDDLEDDGMSSCNFTGDESLHRSKRESTSSIGDVVRASGTTANIVGTAAPALHFVLSPFSVVGGVVGAASGAAQLKEGMSSESGLTDPHLVTKGAVTASVGTTCVALGIAAAAVPAFFAVALGLGVTGLGVAATLDATMDGLCDDCRRNGHDSAEIEGNGDNEARMSSMHEEPKEGTSQSTCA